MTRCERPEDEPVVALALWRIAASWFGTSIDSLPSFGMYRPTLMPGQTWRFFGFSLSHQSSSFVNDCGPSIGQ